MSSSPTLRIGTRGSALALVQANAVRDALAAAGIRAELEIITTQGDRRPPDTAWGEGAFVTAIEDALLGGRIDVAVHSAKDVPTDEEPRLALAAFLPRAASGDVVVLPNGEAARSLADLPTGTRVGTDSPRRTAFLRAARPDLRLHPLHGNVDTRLRRLDEGQSDALVLAEAGLERLGHGARIAFRLPIDLLPPAPGQGALAVQVRADDETALAAVRALDDPATRRAVTIEREILAGSGGGCRAPLGANAIVAPDGSVEVTAGFARPDGSLALISTAASRSRAIDEDPDRAIVDDVLADLSTRAAAAAMTHDWPRVIVTRDVRQAPALMLSLVDRGLTPLVVPAIEIEPAPDELRTAIRASSAYEWVVVTSSNAAAAVANAFRERLTATPADDSAPATGLHRPRIAAVGRATTRALRAAGLRVDFRPPKASGRALAESLPIRPGDRILAPRSDSADDALPEILEARGASVDAVVVYRTREAPASSVPALEDALSKQPRAAIFTSGSTVRGLLALADSLDRRAEVLALPSICIGQPTADEAARLGFVVAATSSRQAVGAIADEAAGYFHAQEVPS